MKMEKENKLPLLYSCSGCSSAAQMANDIALRLDRDAIAEMSCIAGVGGFVKPLVQTAKSGRDIITIDGCPLKCSQACLAQHGIKPKQAFVLSDYDVPKEKHQDYSEEKMTEIYEQLKDEIEDEKNQPAM